MDLEGKAAIVTGGSRGIGAAIACALAEEGADVVFTYRGHEEDQEAKEVAAQIEKTGGWVLPVQAEVSSLPEAERVVTETVAALGHLDILVNNAGITDDAVIWKMTEEQWQSVLTTNLTGCFTYTRAAAPLFREQRSGKIVNITSINGMRGKFGQTNYAASKAGIIGFTKALAKEMGRYNVNVNAVAPGFIMTEMSKKVPEEAREAALAESVLGRLGKPEEVAAVVVFLCTEKARHITGEVIKVDGGQYI